MYLQGDHSARGYFVADGVGKVFSQEILLLTVSGKFSLVGENLQPVPIYNGQPIVLANLSGTGKPPVARTNVPKKTRHCLYSPAYKHLEMV